MASSQVSHTLGHTETLPNTPPPESELIFHNWPEPETEPEELLYFEPPWEYNATEVSKDEDGFNVPYQEALLLHAPKQRYRHTREQPIPKLKHDREMLVAVEVIGLNPIDWKAPDFGWGLPKLPCISGRDFSGKVVKAPKGTSRFTVGDNVIAISTDYRDNRRSAFQQYAVVSDYNACRLPASITGKEAAPLGVAFVAAALALGVCLGIGCDLEHISSGPNIFDRVRSLNREFLPEDIRSECFDKMQKQEKAKKGDWIVVWGGSSASGCCAVQLAKLAGLRVIAVIDVARSGDRMLRHGADLLVDRMDTQRAVSIVKGITKGRLRFGLDTIGKESVGLLAQAMQGDNETEGESCMRAHVVGLVGVPKQPTNGVVYHSVPIKLFHEAPSIGEELMVWLERLLQDKLLSTPDIEVASGGLEGINAALDRLRDGSVNGPRIVVPLVA